MALTAVVYLTLLGPEGLRQLGESILQLRSFGERQLSKIDGIKAPYFSGSHFKEFVVTVDGKTKSIRKILKRMRQKGVLGGIPLDQRFEHLGESALICITEMHTQEEIEELVNAYETALREGS